MKENGLSKTNKHACITCETLYTIKESSLNRDCNDIKGSEPFAEKTWAIIDREQAELRCK